MAGSTLSASVSVETAWGGWLGAWLAGNLVAGVALAGSVDSSSPDDAPFWTLLVSASLLWSALLVMVAFVVRSEHRGGRLVDAVRNVCRLRARPLDLLGIALGVAGQLLLVPAVYLPLRAVWPSTFGQDRLEENALDLWNRATGGWAVALVVMVVIAAPLVEEIVYRGLLQGATATRFRPWLAMVVVAMVFTLVHLRPVEYPGLMAIALVFGACRLLTDRLAMSVVAHVSFNAIGLAVAASGAMG
jgi:uncharacterized protein